MKILAAVTAPASVRRILNHLGLASEAPRLQAARPPPQLAGFYPDPPSPELRLFSLGHGDQVDLGHCTA